MSEQKQNAPKLRFPGFTDPWEQRKLGEVAGFFNGDRSERYPSELDIVDSGIPFINAGDLVNGRVSLMSASKITPEKYAELSGAKIQLNDIVYCLRGTLGKNALVDNMNSGTVASSLVVIRPYSIKPFYLYQVLNSDIEYRQRLVRDEGAAQPNLSAKSVSEYVIPIPTEQEQTLIGSFFRDLDDLITLHQRKLDHLKLKKRGLLQKMFPRDGSDRPEVRFPGFTDAWEQRKLGEVAIFNPISELPDEFEYVDLESVAGTEMTDHRSMFRDNAPSRAQRLATSGDIFYQTVRPYQKNNYLFEMTDENYVFSTGYAQLRPLITGRFLFSVLQRDGFVKVVLDNCTGTSYPAINANDLARIEIMISDSVEEQTAIGSFFRDLDDLITLHQRKLDHLKLQKKALLQQMFV